MKLISSSFSDGEPISEANAFCIEDPDTHVALSDNFNPEISWQDLPPDTDMLLYEGLHGAMVTDECDVARFADGLVDVSAGLVFTAIAGGARDERCRRSQDRLVGRSFERLREQLERLLQLSSLEGPLGATDELTHGPRQSGPVVPLQEWRGRLIAKPLRIESQYAVERIAGPDSPPAAEKSHTEIVERIVEVGRELDRAPKRRDRASTVTDLEPGDAQEVVALGRFL